MSQFEFLARYAEVLGTEGTEYWTGYRFVGSDDLGNLPEGVEDLLLNPSNQGQGDQAAADSGTCLTIGRDGKLYKRLCTDERPAVCYRQFQG